MLLTGCPRNRPQPAPPAGPRPSVALHVLVVNEPELAEAIDRLRGEWAERIGGELRTSAKSWQGVIDQEPMDADVIVFPSRYLGELCVRDWLRPVRSSVLESDDLRAADYYPLVRHELISWGGQVMALPLGVEPAGIAGETGDDPAILLLAEAAPAAVSKERLGVLFDSETMKPRIAEPPFVDALAQMVQSKAENGSVRSRGGPAVPVLGYSDRLIAVTNSSRNAATAFKLLEWLASPETSSQLARAGDGTMPVRRSLASSAAWYEPRLSAGERAERGKSLEAALDQSEFVLIPRIPGVDDYLAALDQAVKEALSEGVAPRAALDKASRRWEEITATRGRDDQRQAYLKHLGFGEP